MFIPDWMVLTFGERKLNKSDHQQQRIRLSAMEVYLKQYPAMNLCLQKARGWVHNHRLPGGKGAALLAGEYSDKDVGSATGC